MIEFNKHHYSDLWERREHYRKTLGLPYDLYHYYVNMIGKVMDTCDPTTTKFPHTIQVKQELIKIIMLAQADAVQNKLDVSSLKPKQVKRNLIQKLFKRKKDAIKYENKTAG